MDGARPAGPAPGVQSRPLSPQPRPLPPQPRPAGVRAGAAREQAQRDTYASHARGGQDSRDRDPYVREQYTPPNRQQYAASGHVRATGQSQGRGYAAQPPQRSESEPASVKQRKVRRGSGSSAWKVALQFVVGLVVIAVVAGAIVWLYVRYYQ